MGEQVTELAPIAADLQPTLERAVSQWPSIREFLVDANASGIDSVFFVGCGASLYVSQPAHYVLERQSPSIASFRITSSEFNLICPARLGKRSLVVLISSSGGTPETVAAVETARTAGAILVAVTDYRGSPLADGADVSFVYGSEESDWPAKHAILAAIAHGLVDVRREAADYDSVFTAFRLLPPALISALRSQESVMAEMASALKAEELAYVLASGPSFGSASCLAMCYLQEMQWMHASAVNAGDFFHGAFEILTEEVPTIVLMAEDVTRPMAERALSFVRRHSSKCFPIDTLEMELPGIPEDSRPDVTPVLLAAVTSRLARHLAAARNHSLDLRRYMYKVPY